MNRTFFFLIPFSIYGPFATTSYPAVHRWVSITLNYNFLFLFCNIKLVLLEPEWPMVKHTQSFLRSEWVEKNCELFEDESHIFEKNEKKKRNFSFLDEWTRAHRMRRETAKMRKTIASFHTKSGKTTTVTVVVKIAQKATYLFLFIDLKQKTHMEFE